MIDGKAKLLKKPVPQKAFKAINATKKPKNTASLLSKHISLPLLIHIKVMFKRLFPSNDTITTSTAVSSQTPGDSQKAQQRKPYLTPKSGVSAANDPENAPKKMRTIHA